MVQTLKEIPFFSSIEQSFVRLAKTNQEIDEESYFLAFLFFASRRGHIAIDISDEITAGFQEIDDDLKDKIIKGSKLFKGSPLVVNLSTKFYLQKNYALETKLLDLIKERNSSACLIPINIIDFDKSHLLENQYKAILKAASSNLLILTGGPGTGKTYTATNIIKILFNSLKEEERKTFEIAIAAPTGKATSHLYTNLTAKLEDKEILSHISAKTLHSLLNIKIDHFDLFDEEAKKLSADLVIVDESSMIDLSLMSYLFNALKPGSRLILIGDRHQLPPIESGSLFADLCELKPEFVVELNVSVRSELKSIIDLSEEIKKGHFELLHQESFRLPYLEDPLKNQKMLINLMLDNDFESFRLLAPIRKGPLGIEELNRLCLESFKKRYYKKSGFTFPIIFIENDYKNEIFNGETGLLYFDIQGVAYQIESKGIIGHFGKFPPFELAYCMSIHKSQGSEFNHVLVVLPEGSESFGREILYTAVTRAKKSVRIHSSDETIRACLKKENRRVSSILSRSK
jgi:exodeoxyribonuclease V alpha subunit